MIVTMSNTMITIRITTLMADMLKLTDLEAIAKLLKRKISSMESPSFENETPVRK